MIPVNSASSPLAGASAASISTLPEIEASGLRISCAIEAESAPIAASRSERLAFFSSARTRLTSWKMMMRPIRSLSASRSAAIENPRSIEAPSLARSKVHEARVSRAGPLVSAAAAKSGKTSASRSPITSSTSSPVMRAAAPLK